MATYTYTGPPSIDRKTAIIRLADYLRELLPVPDDYRAEGYDMPSQDVRIRVLFDIDAWFFSTGDSSYEQDHRGCWGKAVLLPSTTPTGPDGCDEIAADMWAEAEDQYTENTT